MIIIAGLVLGLVALYFWLVGNWFARVVVTIALMPLMALAGSAITTINVPPSGQTSMAVMGALFGLAMAWVIGSVPTYYGRWAALPSE